MKNPSPLATRHAGQGFLLRNLPREARIFAVMIMLSLGVGYGHALAYVYLTTRIVPAGIQQRFNGTPASLDTSISALPPSEELEEDTTLTSSATSQAATSQATTSQAAASQAAAQSPGTVTGEIEYQKSLAEMLNIIHTHILSMTFLFSLSGLLTLLTASTGTGFRKFIVIEPFIGILVTFAGLWLMRFVHPAFSWLVSLSGITMALCFAGQCWAVLQEIRMPSDVKPNFGIQEPEG